MRRAWGEGSPAAASLRALQLCSAFAGFGEVWELLIGPGLVRKVVGNFKQ